MNFKLKTFTVTVVAACVLILHPAGSIYAADINMSDEKKSVHIENEKTEVLSKTDKIKKKPVNAGQGKEIFNKINSRISENNMSYWLIYTGIFFAVLSYAFLALRVKEDKHIQKQNSVGADKQ